MTAKLYWVNTGDSIAAQTFSWFYKYLPATFPPELEAGATNTNYRPNLHYAVILNNGNIFAMNMSFSSSQLNSGPNLDPYPLTAGTGVTQLTSVYIDPVVANKTIKSFAGATGPSPISPRKFLFSTAIGTNDIGNNAITAQGEASGIASCLAGRKAAGYDFTIISSLLPRGDGNANETKRLAFNAIVADPAWRAANSIDGIYDFASDPIMGNPANVTDTTYYADLVHPTDAGYVLMVPYVTAAMNPILAML